jgi:hypothetical protein
LRVKKIAYQKMSNVTCHSGLPVLYVSGNQETHKLRKTCVSTIRIVKYHSTICTKCSAIGRILLATNWIIERFDEKSADHSIRIFKNIVIIKFAQQLQDQNLRYENITCAYFNHITIFVCKYCNCRGRSLP